MDIRFVRREEVIDIYLDKVNRGYELTEEDKEFLNDMANGR